MNDQLFGFQLRQHLLDEQKRQLQLIGDLPSAGVAAGRQQLDQQRFDLALGQARFGQRRRLERQKLGGRRGGSRETAGSAGRPLRDSLDALQQLFQFAVLGRSRARRPAGRGRRGTVIPTAVGQSRRPAAGNSGQRFGQLRQRFGRLFSHRESSAGSEWPGRNRTETLGCACGTSSQMCRL